VGWRGWRRTPPSPAFDRRAYAAHRSPPRGTAGLTPRAAVSRVRRCGLRREPRSPAFDGRAYAADRGAPRRTFSFAPRTAIPRVRQPSWRGGPRSSALDGLPVARAARRAAGRLGRVTSLRAVRFVAARLGAGGAMLDDDGERAATKGRVGKAWGMTGDPRRAERGPADVAGSLVDVRGAGCTTRSFFGTFGEASRLSV
jgi:hypothetical protein